MATTTSYHQEQASSRILNRRPGVGYQIPGIQLPKARISSEYGPALTNEELNDVARILSRIDGHLIAFTRQIHELILSGRLNNNDPDARRMAGEDIADIESIERQIDEIKTGTRVFSEMYLTERHMLYYWRKGFSFMSQILRLGNPVDQSYLNYEKKAFDQAEILEPVVVDAASAGLLGSEHRLLLADRWSILDLAADEYHEITQSPRTLATWIELSKRIRTATQDKPVRANNAILPTPSWTSTVILWITFTGIAMTNVWTFALGYRYSPHEPGTTKDADFWFTLQACLTQFFGLVISCIPLWKVAQLSKWTWIPPTVFAMICVALASPLYVAVPTEWSNFLTLTATSVQAFLTLRFALVH